MNPEIVEQGYPCARHEGVWRIKSIEPFIHTRRQMDVSGQLQVPAVLLLNALTLMNTTIEATVYTRRIILDIFCRRSSYEHSRFKSFQSF
jgi:hypothetical protein